MTGCHAGAELEREKLATDLRELENSVKHLERSNKELEEALKEAPGDADFESAIEENQEVIRKREKEIEELKKKIKAHDDLYRPVVAKEPPKPASGVGSNAEEQDRIDTGGAAGPGASQAAQPPSVTEGQEGGEGVYL